MNTFYSIGKEQSVIKLLHVTDSHLFSDLNNDLLGVNTYASFQAVLNEVQQQAVDFNAILATGDLIQDHQFAGYLHFAKMVKPLATPVFWLEGNHDQQPQMGLHLGQFDYIHPEKQIFAGKHWQIIMLNSQMMATPSGYLSKGQLAWLNQKLNETADLFTLIVLHHNILPTNSAWLDQHSLKNSNALAKVLTPFSNIKAILHGHIHQEVDSLWNGIRVLSTPSTCIQFKPNCNNFTLDSLPQGWREIALFDDGHIETQVKRLKTNVFFPKTEAIGY